MNATTVRALTEGILARLRARIPTVLVQSFPNPQQVRKLGDAILVVYRGATYGTVQDTDDMVQERELHIDVHVVSRNLADASGAYDRLEAVRLALIGFKVPGFTKLRPTKEAFLGGDDGIWIYALTFAATTRSAELDESIAGPLLQRLTAASDYTISEITSG